MKGGTLLLEKILYLDGWLSISVMIGLEESITTDCAHLLGESRCCIGMTRTIFVFRAAVYIFVGSDPALFQGSFNLRMCPCLEWVYAAQSDIHLTSL